MAGASAFVPVGSPGASVLPAMALGISPVWRRAAVRCEASIRDLHGESPSHLYALFTKSTPAAAESKPKPRDPTPIQRTRRRAIVKRLTAISAPAPTATSQARTTSTTPTTFSQITRPPLFASLSADQDGGRSLSSDERYYGQSPLVADGGHAFDNTKVVI